MIGAPVLISPTVLAVGVYAEIFQYIRLPQEIERIGSGLQSPWFNNAILPALLRHKAVGINTHHTFSVPGDLIHLRDPEVTIETPSVFEVNP